MLITAWCEVLGDLDYTEAMSALSEHRRTAPGVWVEPGHLVNILIRRRRTEGMKPTLVEMCPVHDEYPANLPGGCTRCAESPEDLPRHIATGWKPEKLSLASLLTAGKNINEVG